MIRRFFRLIVLFFKFNKVKTKAEMQHRVNVFFKSIALFSREMGNVIIAYLTLKKFTNINDWQINDLFFLFSFIFISYSIVIFFFVGIRDFDRNISEGRLDRYLVCPLGVLFQVVASNIDYVAVIGHGAAGFILLYISSKGINIHWDAVNVLYYTFTVISGALIQVAIMLVFAGLSFWIQKTVFLKSVAIMGMRRFASYPMSIYPQIIQKALMFVVPFAFVNYFPAQFYLHKPDMSLYWTGYIYIAPFVGIFMFALSYLFYRYGLRHYSSTGN